MTASPLRRALSACLLMIGLACFGLVVLIADLALLVCFLAAFCLALGVCLRTGWFAPADRDLSVRNETTIYVVLNEALADRLGLDADAGEQIEVLSRRIAAHIADLPRSEDAIQVRPAAPAMDAGHAPTWRAGEAA